MKFNWLELGGDGKKILRGSEEAGVFEAARGRKEFLGVVQDPKLVQPKMYGKEWKTAEERLDEYLDYMNKLNFGGEK
jgi:hypothetical protein